MCIIRMRAHLHMHTTQPKPLFGNADLETKIA